MIKSVKVLLGWGKIHTYIHTSQSQRPRNQKLPRLLSKDSDDDDVLISMIEKEANIKDIYTKFDENLMEAKGLEKAGEINVKSHPGFSLYWLACIQKNEKLARAKGSHLCECEKNNTKNTLL